MSHAQGCEKMRYRLLETDLEVFSPPLPGEQEDSRVFHESKSIAGEPAARLLSALVRMFLASRKREPYYLDLAASYCYSNNIPPIPTLWRLQCEASVRRERGEPMPSQRKQIKNEIAKRGIFSLMGNLIYAGRTLEIAANQAAEAYQYIYPDLHSRKASSLQQGYLKDVRRPGIEEQYFEAWEKAGFRGSPDWQRVMELIPEVGDDLKGERR